MKSHAVSVDAYLRDLPPEKREVISTVRTLMLASLPSGYEEAMNWGMIAYQIPESRTPAAYRGPLMYAGLAAQKNYFVLHLMGVYGSPKHYKMLADAFRQAGMKMDIGKACLRFKSVNDLPLDAIGNLVGSISVEAFLDYCEKARTRSASARKTT